MNKKELQNEFSSCGGVAGFQAPLGIRKRKKKVDEMISSVDELSIGDVIMFFTDMKDNDLLDVEEMLDKGLYSELAEKIVSSCREKRLREVIRNKIKEVVRKSPDGGYVLFSPNPGKGHRAKSAGRFASKLAAKRAQLSRFPPKDPEKLQRLKDEIEKLEKDGEGGAKKGDKPWLKQHTTKRGKESYRDSSKNRDSSKKGKKKEESIEMIATVIAESMFREEKVKSDWDEYVSRLSKQAVASDKKFKKMQDAISQKSVLALKNAFDVLAKGLGKKKFLAKIGGDAGNSALSFSVQDKESKGTVGPFTILVDNGVLRVEPTETARSSLINLSPDRSKLLRAELITLQDDHFDNIGSDIDKEIERRDSYLSSLEEKQDKFISSLSPLEVAILKNLIVTKYRKIG